MTEKRPNQDLASTVRRIYRSGPADISCDQAADLMARIGDLQLNLETAQQRFPQLWQHLESCVDCLAELKFMQELEHKDPSLIADLKVPKRPGQPTLAEKASELIGRVIQFPGFESAVLAPTRGSELDAEPVTIEIGQNLILEIDIAISETDKNQRTLFLTLENDHAEAPIDVEGILVRLLDLPTRNEIGRASFDHLGDAIIDHLQPETPYQIELTLPTEKITIDNFMTN